MRTTAREVEVNERKFVIKKMNPMLSCYLLTTISTKVLPMALQIALKAIGQEPAVSTGKEMSFEEFETFQKHILSCVSERLPAGDTPIFDKSGNFAVIGLEDDGPLILRLTVDALQFNFKDFFTASLWKGLIPEEYSSMLSQFLTSINFSSHPLSKVFGDITNSGTEPTQ